MMMIEMRILLKAFGWLALIAASGALGWFIHSG
jgi:hypothetical protein